MVDVYLDEKFIGTVSDKDKFLNEFKIKRRKGDIPESINLNYNKEFDEIFIDSKKGRCRRPLIIVENGVSKLTNDKIELIKKGELRWRELFNKGIIEYIDAGEEENCYVALSEDELTKEHTHLEISPVTIL